MSSAFKCDACGRFIEGTPEHYMGTTVVKKYKFLPKLTMFTLPTKEIIFSKELCPECSKKVCDILKVKE